MRLGVFFASVGVLVAAGALFVRHRYQQTRYVGAYTLVPRTVEENAAEGRAAGLTPVQVGPQRALLRAPKAGHDWLIYWGGNSETYFRDAVEVVRALELPEDLGVLVVAPPGYDSPGHPTPEGIALEAGRTVDWLRAQHGAERVVLASFSLGCFSVYAAAERGVAGAVMVGVSELITANDPGRFIRLREPHFYRRREPGPKVPSLVINGELDWPSDARIVSAWLGSRLVLIPGVDHQASRLHPVALSEARAFVLSTLGR